MDTTAIFTAIFGALIGVHLVQIAHRRGRRERLVRLAALLLSLAVLIMLIAGDRGSREAHQVRYAIEMAFIASAVIVLLVGQRADGHPKKQGSAD